MARYNEILAGRYNRFLQKLLQMKGGPPAAQLSGDIQTSLPLFSGVENRYLEGWKRFAIPFSLGAMVAADNSLRLRNPVGSNVVAVVEMITPFDLQSGAIDYGPYTTDYATGQATLIVNLDSRQGVTSGSTLIASSAQPGIQGVGQFLFLFRTLATVTFQLVDAENLEIPVLPGTGIQWRSVTQNTANGINFVWRERALEESERT